MREMVYRRREWMVTMSHLRAMISRDKFLRLNLIFNLVSDENNVFFFSLIWLFFICKISKLWWNRVFKSIPVFPVFSVGLDNHRLVICLRVKVITCNILMEYSVVHTAWTLKHDYSTKIGTFFSGLSFCPTLLSDILFSCSNHM